jgi:hypothetical protein
MNFLNKMRNNKIKIPDIKRILFNALPKENKCIRDFMTHCFPDNLELFTLNGSGNRISIDYYSPALRQALPKVTREIYISTSALSKECFETVVKSSAKCERLTVAYCTLDTDSACDFSGPEYNINYFGLSTSGRFD